MPPGGKNLSTAEREAFLAAIAEPIMAHEQMKVATRGRAVLRRLNRYEYENSIRNLFCAPWLHSRNALPEDGLVHRLNKSGQALDISHVQMARYIEAAEQAISLVFKRCPSAGSTTALLRAGTEALYRTDALWSVQSSSGVGDDSAARVRRAT